MQCKLKWKDDLCTKIDMDSHFKIHEVALRRKLVGNIHKKFSRYFLCPFQNSEYKRDDDPNLLPAIQRLIL